MGEICHDYGFQIINEFIDFGVKGISYNFDRIAGR